MAYNVYLIEIIYKINQNYIFTSPKFNTLEMSIFP